MRASASYWLCRVNPLVMVAATYTSAANPAMVHADGAINWATVAVMGVVAGTGALLGNVGGGPTGVTPRTRAKE